MRINFIFDSSPNLDIVLLTDVKLDCLRLAITGEIQSTVLSTFNSSCALHLIHTLLLKQCIPELLPIITAILNTSLKTGNVPALFKYDIIRPHLNKSSLETEIFFKYRPVWVLCYHKCALQLQLLKHTDHTDLSFWFCIHHHSYSDRIVLQGEFFYTGNFSQVY